MRVRRVAVSRAPAGVDSPPAALNCLAPSVAPARRTLQLVLYLTYNECLPVVFIIFVKDWNACQLDWEANVFLRYV
eukprot:488798-Pelagomonas_calceolata.AAC.1